MRLIMSRCTTTVYFNNLFNIYQRSFIHLEFIYDLKQVTSRPCCIFGNYLLTGSSDWVTLPLWVFVPHTSWICSSCPISLWIWIMYWSLSSSPSSTDPSSTSNNFKMYTSKMFPSLSIPSSISESICSIFLRCPSFSAITCLLFLCNLNRSLSRARTSSTEITCVFKSFRRPWILPFLRPILFSCFLKTYCSLDMISYVLKYSTVNLNLRLYYYSIIYTKK